MPNLFEEFEDIHFHESIDECEEDYDAGLQETEILYCPAMHVNPFAIPSLLGSFESSGQISEDITTKNGRFFERIKAHLDQNELTGEVNKTELNLYLFGLKSNRIGLARKLNVMPGIYIVKDMNDRYFVIGNTLSPAIVSTINLSSGKVNDDLSGMQIKLKSNMIFFEYKGQIPEINNNSDFTDEYTSEYR